MVIEKHSVVNKKVPEGFVYSSDNNTEWMSVPALRTWMDANREKIGNI